MKFPKKFWTIWTFTKPCHPQQISCVESFHPHVLKTCFEATRIKLWEADIISKNYVILVPFGYMHYGHQLYQVTLSLHQRKKCIKTSIVSSLYQCGRQGMRCPVFSQRFGCYSLYWRVINSVLGGGVPGFKFQDVTTKC